MHVLSVIHFYYKKVDFNVVGMVVDSVGEVLRLASLSVAQAPEIISSKIKADCLEGVGKLDDRLLIWLDLERVLGEEEISQVAAVGEIHG